MSGDFKTAMAALAGRGEGGDSIVYSMELNQVTTTILDKDKANSRAFLSRAATAEEIDTLGRRYDKIKFLAEDFPQHDEVLVRVLPNQQSNPKLKKMAKQRKKAGLPHEPVPSLNKQFLWKALDAGGSHLAQALRSAGRHGEAVPVLRELFDRAIQARDEIWEEVEWAHHRAADLATAYFLNGQIRESQEWLHKGLQMCKDEAPGGRSAAEKRLKDGLDRNRSFLLANRAGPVQAGSEGGGGSDETTAKNWKSCWNCGKQGSQDCNLLRCSKCLALKIATPACYCCKDCQVQDWGRHKLYHKLQKSTAAMATLELRNPDDPGRSKEGPPKTPDGHPNAELNALIADGLHHWRSGDKVKARRLLEKAIKLNPNHPTAHCNLGSMFRESGNVEGMVKEYTRKSLRYRGPLILAKVAGYAGLTSCSPIFPSFSLIFSLP